jgi:hypothetical protein
MELQDAVPLEERLVDVEQELAALCLSHTTSRRRRLLNGGIHHDEHESVRTAVYSRDNAPL